MASQRSAQRPSHGCIRLSTTVITWLARRVGAGVPLSIRG